MRERGLLRLHWILGVRLLGVKRVEEDNSSDGDSDGLCV